MIYTDEELLTQLENVTNVCGTLLACALDKRGVTPELTAETRQMIADMYLNVSDTRWARGIER